MYISIQQPLSLTGQVTAYWFAIIVHVNTHKKKKKLGKDHCTFTKRQKVKMWSGRQRKRWILFIQGFTCTVWVGMWHFCYFCRERVTYMLFSGASVDSLLPTPLPIFWRSHTDSICNISFINSFLLISIFFFCLFFFAYCFFAYCSFAYF